MMRFFGGEKNCSEIAGRDARHAIQRRGLTRIELLVVVALAFVLGLMALPFFAGHEHPSRRVRCLSYLKQIGAGFQVYANDHNGRYPYFTNQVGIGYVWTNFAAAGSAIGSPKFLICPADAARLKSVKKPAPADFSTGPDGYSNPAHQERDLSYFYGLSANREKPGTVLAGDRNLTANQALHPYSPDATPMWSYAGNGPSGGSPGVALGGGSTIPNCGWNSAIHNFNGNMLLADGSVQQFTTSALVAQLNASGDTNNFCLFPISSPGEK